MVGGEQYGSRIALERRAYPRFELTLTGICSISGSADIPCTVIDMSIGGAALRSDVDCAIDAPALVVLPQVGLVRGTVTRRFPGGFAIAFGEGRPQRERVVGFLTWFVAHQLDDDLEERAFERVVPLRRIVNISVGGNPDGFARIVDVSRSGVAMTTTVGASVGEDVRIGGSRAVVVRLFTGGFAARFLEPLAILDATIIL